MLSIKRRAKMKKVILCALVLAANGVLVNSVLSQEIVPRYLVTYVRSQIAGPIRAATAVTVTNQSSESCAVEVEWFRSNPATSLCKLNVTIASHGANQFCSRNLIGSITNCAPFATPANCPGSFAFEGTAIVSSSSDTSDCRLLGVEARVYYTTSSNGTNDTAISAISNSKIVFAGEGNLGD
jgi:hypothetical protein